MVHILGADQFDRDQLEAILLRAGEMEKQCREGTVQKILVDKIIACIFFEPSTRTRLSFETAALKLGAKVISVENARESSSAYKGESIEDTTRMLCGYADAIVIRHNEAGSVLASSIVANKPIINAGDGANQHPSQALLDLYTIKKEQGKLEGLTVAFVGDLLYGRTLHSLLPLLMLYPNNTFYFVAPKELALPKEYKQKLSEKSLKFIETENLDDALQHADIVYMTRVQKERFADLAQYEKIKDSYLLKVAHLKEMKTDAIIMHPLPRVNEIDPHIDADPRASYFRQAQNGVYVRMALFLYALGL